MTRRSLRESRGRETQKGRQVWFQELPLFPANTRGPHGIQSESLQHEARTYLIPSNRGFLLQLCHPRPPLHHRLLMLTTARLPLHPTITTTHPLPKILKATPHGFRNGLHLLHQLPPFNLQ